MSKPLSIRIIELGDESTTRLEEWRQILLQLSTSSLPGIVEDGPLGRELRGAAAVATLAELERLLRESLVELSHEIGRAGVQIRDLVPGLRALVANPHFQAIMSSSRGDPHWDNRALVTRLETNSEIAVLPSRLSGSPQPPLDGKTIRTAHIERIWLVLELEGDAIPTATMGVSLNAMSTLRNDVAHGNAPLSEIFHPQNFGKSAADLAEHIRQSVRLIDHVCLSVSSYASGRKYRV